MKAALISLGSISSEWTVEKMQHYFDEVDMVDIRQIEIAISGKECKVLYKGKPLPKYDCIYAKGSFRYIDLLQSITTALEQHTYMPLRANAFTIGHDKLLTQLELQKSKVPMPKTYISPTAETAKEMLKTISYPIVMKFPKGTHGKGVMFADSAESASSVLDALVTLKQPVLVQEYIETGGVDTRAIVVGDKVVAAMKRKAIQGEKRANIHAGGTGEVAELDSHTKKIAIDSAKAIGAEICAVDILEGPVGPVVIEANLSPGLQAITKVTKIDVADKIAKWLAKRTKEQLKGKTEKGKDNILAEMGIEGDGDTGKEIISTVDFRGNRMLLPEVITNITKFGDNEELSIKAEKGKLMITKFQ